ncbi:putative odorant receptor 92a [Vanessa tameamea]|uniref:Odorant receptor n=1 Tax=Vanessa tameamea TaxID=334116 RepID=A0A8B8IDC1_VANTA|nr:putative odorant receptor 92a [Vanessa tameamea]
MSWLTNFLRDVFSPQCKGVNFKKIVEGRIRDAGLWHDRDAYGIHPIAKISIVCFLSTNLTQIVALLLAKDDPKALFAGISILSFCMMGFLKLWSLLSNEKRWRSIINQALSLENEQLNNYSPCDYESDDEEKHSFTKHIDSYTRDIFLISCNLTRIYSFTAVVYIVSPFLEYAIYMKTGQDISSMPHILPEWSPLDSYTVGYIVTILVEVVAALYCVKVHIAFDLTAVGLMIFIRGQFSCLHKYSELIGGQGKSSNLEEKRDKRAYYRIIKCHSINVLLINTVHELEILLRNILGIYFFVATLTLCSVAVQLNEDQVSTTQLISLLQYMGATLTQLFLFCHYGDAVLNEISVIQGQGPFCSARWCLSPKVHQEIAILGAGMSRPYRLRAGPFNSLDLPSFIQIIRTAYSYYAFLRQT